MLGIGPRLPELHLNPQSSKKHYIKQSKMCATVVSSAILRQVLRCIQIKCSCARSHVLRYYLCCHGSTTNQTISRTEPPMSLKKQLPNKVSQSQNKLRTRSGITNSSGNPSPSKAMQNTTGANVKREVKKQLTAKTSNP